MRDLPRTDAEYSGTAPVELGGSLPDDVAEFAETDDVSDFLAGEVVLGRSFGDAPLGSRPYSFWRRPGAKPPVGAREPVRERCCLSLTGWPARVCESWQECVPLF